MLSASPTPPWSRITATRVPGAQRHSGGHTRRQVRPQHRNRHPARDAVGGREVAGDRGGDGRCARGGSGGVTPRFWVWRRLDSVADPADDVGERGEVAQLEAVVAGDAVVAADGGEDLRLLDGVDAEVGLQVQVDVEQVRRIAGELGDDADHGLDDVVTRGRRRRLGCRFYRDGNGRRRRGRCVRRCRRGRGRAGLVADPGDHVGERREVAQLEAVVAGHAVVLADRGEDLGLLDGVDAEVGLQVQVEVEQFGRIAGELGDNAQHGFGQLVPARGQRGRRSGPPPARPP